MILELGAVRVRHVVGMLARLKPIARAARRMSRSSGVTIMLRPATATAASCATSGSRRPWPRRESDDHEGEFAGLRQQQRDLGGDRPRHPRTARAAPNRIAALIAISPTTAEQDPAGMLRHTTRRSIVMPTVMKKMPSSRPLNGSRSTSI